MGTIGLRLKSSSLSQCGYLGLVYTNNYSCGYMDSYLPLQRLFLWSWDPQKKKGMFWDFTVEWHLFFLGWQQPRSPGLFPQGYFLLISLPLCDFFSTYGIHRSLKTETQTHTNGGGFNMHSTCPSRAWKFKKNNRAILMNSKAFINSNHFLPGFIGDYALVLYKL